MDANILCRLIAQQIDPKKWQLWGQEVHWLDPTADTAENAAIVTDIKSKYDAQALPIIKEKKIKSLTSAWRDGLAGKIGSIGQQMNLLMQAMAFETCIRAGIVKDQEIIDDWTKACNAMLDSLGGPTIILATLQQLVKPLQDYVQGLTKIYTDVLAAKTAEEVEAVTL